MLSELSLPSGHHATASQHALIYFISGNPGLIEYYADFFRFLRKQIDEMEMGTAYDIYGRNLLGFSDEDHEPFSQDNPPYDLEAQIKGSYDDLAARRRPDDDSKAYDFVIVMGHSVGAYIAVEVFHRHMKEPSGAPHLHLRHGFLLFPTITDIALSPSGYQMSLMRYVPSLENNAHRYAKFFLSWLNTPSKHWFVRNVLGFSPQAATLTAEFLSSRDGVWQGLYLGKYELEEIGEDKWGEELWEVAKDQEELYGGAPKFYLYYAKEDHWVANDMRDKFIEKRKQHSVRGGRTSVEVDSGGVKHAFCTTEETSLLIAKKVHAWIQEIEGFQKAVASHDDRPCNYTTKSPSMPIIKPKKSSDLVVPGLYLPEIIAALKQKQDCHSKNRQMPIPVPIGE